MKVLKVLAWIVGTPLVLFGLLLLARFISCGPNSADVKVMKPMAEKISAYIVKHGIPKSLKDIPDLPYGLYQNKNEDTSFYHFDVNHIKYTIFVKGNDMLEFQSEVKRGNGFTWMWVIFKIDKNSNYTLQKPIESFLTHTSGICSTLKQ